MTCPTRAKPYRLTSHFMGLGLGVAPSPEKLPAPGGLALDFTRGSEGGLCMAIIMDSENREFFDSTGNPKYAWEEIKNKLDNGKELPLWVIKYLSHTANALLSIRTDVPRYSSGIANAIGAGDRRIWFNYKHSTWEYRIYKDLLELKSKTNSVEKAIDLYIASGVCDQGFESLRKIYYKVHKEIRIMVESEEHADEQLQIAIMEWEEDQYVKK